MSLHGILCFEPAEVQSSSKGWWRFHSWKREGVPKAVNLHPLLPCGHFLLVSAVPVCVSCPKGEILTFKEALGAYERPWRS